MDKHEDVGPDRPGRKSGLKRLVYRPGRDNQDPGKRGGKQHWRDSRDWSTIKDQLRLTIKRAPEVVIKVRGGREKGQSDAEAHQGVLRYMMYISRSGELPTIDQDGERLEGRAAVRETHGRWDLDLQRQRSGKGEPLHPTFYIIFSMPAKSDPDKVLAAVQDFARNHFHGHQYVMALHTKETDPAPRDVPEHPHVHVALRAENQDGRRLHIRKGTLRAWRESFAAELRARGIEANATSRAERGASLKRMTGAEWHIEDRIRKERERGEEPTTRNLAKEARIRQAASDLAAGRTEPKPWEIAMEARRRDVLRDLGANAARLRAEGDVELADQVDAFMQNMPALDTERSQIQRALVQQVNQRIAERDHARAPGGEPEPR